MKLTTAIAALAGAAIAAPVDDIEKRATAINYVQNYNGNLANFKYNQGAGTFSCSWNNPGDFVVGLGWTTGTTRYVPCRLLSFPLLTHPTGASPSADRTPQTRARITLCTAG